MPNLVEEARAHFRNANFTNEDLDAIEIGVRWALHKIAGGGGCTHWRGPNSAALCGEIREEHGIGFCAISDHEFQP